MGRARFYTRKCGFIFGSTFVAAIVDGGFAIMAAENYIISGLDGMVLNAIYDIGAASNYVEENGFGAYDYAGNGNWTLNKTPDTGYIVPSSVAGKTINRVQLDLISGEPTFVYPVELITENSGKCPSYIKIMPSYLNFWFDNIFYFWNTSIDLTECGDTIEFPTSVLSASQNITIYVTSAVKENYQNYDFIQVKQ